MRRLLLPASGVFGLALGFAVWLLLWSRLTDDLLGTPWHLADGRLVLDSLFLAIVDVAAFFALTIGGAVLATKRARARLERREAPGSTDPQRCQGSGRTAPITSARTTCNHCGRGISTVEAGGRRRIVEHTVSGQEIAQQD